MNKHLLSLLFVVLLTSCSEPPAPADKTAVSVSSTIITVSEQPLAEIYTTSGTLMTEDRVDIASRLTGFIRTMKVHEGSRVRKGELLLSIDPSEINAQLMEAGARVTQAKARFNDAQNDQQRFKSLFEQKLIAINQYQKAELDLRLAAEELRAAEAQQARQRAQLEYADIRSPVSGVVVARHKLAGDMATPGIPLLTIENVDALVVKTFVKEHHIQHISLGTRADIGIDATGLTTHGTVSKIVPAAEPGTYSYQIELALDEIHGLRSGMFARVSFTLGHREGLALPTSIIVHRDDLSGVYIIGDGNIANFRLVRTGRQFGELTEILSGLNEGDRVASTNLNRIFTGVRIQADQQNQPDAGGS